MIAIPGFQLKAQSFNAGTCPTNIPIPDSDVTGIQDTIMVTGVGTSLGTDVILESVTLHLTHTWSSDLDIYLTSPNGVMVELTTDNGGSGRQYGDDCVDMTVLNMSASTLISGGTANFVGTYIPEGNFNDFNDASDANGNWILSVSDDAGGDTGNLEFAELFFTTPPTCPQPDSLYAAAITSSSADLGWIEMGGASLWQIEWDTTGFTPGTGNLALATNPQNISGLNPVTDYSFYVRAICGLGDTSTWKGPFNFSTPCVAPIISAFPWTENFDGETVPAMPCGWIIDNANGDANTWVSSSIQANSAPNSMAVTYNTTIPSDDWAFTPQLELTGGQAYQLSFAFRAQSATYPEKLTVMYGNGQNSGAMSTLLFDSTFNSTTFETATAVFMPSITGSYFIGFHGNSDANMWRVYVDDVTVDMSTSVYHNEGRSNYLVYPNPTQGMVTVNGLDKNTSIRICNIQGQIVYENNAVQSTQLSIDLNGRAKGLYFITLTSDTGSEQLKVIIQ